jgi:multidrug efflux system outer membrane protein
MTKRTIRHFVSAVLALSGAIALGGCMSFIPEYQRPGAPVSSAFPYTQAADGTADRQAASDIAWQDYFRDPRLQRLIGIALNNNRDMRVAVVSIERARAQYQVRRADELPTVGIGVSGNRQPSPSGGTASVYTAGFAVSAYELDFFGRVRSLGQAALAQYLSTEEAGKTAQISLVSAVANTYLSMLADDELLEVTRRTLATREESLKLTKLKFDNGAASELDFRQAESLLEGARVALAQLTRQRALDENALVLLLGQPMPVDLPSGLQLIDQQLLADLPAGLPSEVLVRRPDVRQAEQQLIAANANIGAARAAFFPRITLTGSAGTASNHLSGLFKAGSSAWTFAPQLFMPIFDFGRNQANLDVAQADRDIAVAQYEQAIQTGFREVADTLAGRATLSDQLHAQQAQASAEEARFRLADLRYRNGAASYLDVLDAQRSLFTAQQQVVQVKAAGIQNRVTLYRVLGGGWTDADLLSAPSDVTEVSAPGTRGSSRAAGDRKTASVAPVR